MGTRKKERTRAMKMLVAEEELMTVVVCKTQMHKHVSIRKGKFLKTMNHKQE